MVGIAENLNQENEESGFAAWFNRIVEEAMLPHWTGEPMPCDDQGIAYT